MKAKEIEELVRQHLLPQLPNWDVKRGIMFMKPIGQCLCAVGFGTSSFDSGLVYNDAWVRPLYLPSGYQTYSFIKRLRRPGGLRLMPDPTGMQNVLVAIREQAIPFFATVDTPEKIAARLRSISYHRLYKLAAFFLPPKILRRMLLIPNPYELEAISMSCVLTGDREGARRALARAIEGLLEDDRDWCIAMAERLRAMKDRMESNYEAFSAELPGWRLENLEAMKLSGFQ